MLKTLSIVLIAVPMTSGYHLITSTNAATNTPPPKTSAQNHLGGCPLISQNARVQSKNAITYPVFIMPTATTFEAIGK